MKEFLEAMKNRFTDHNLFVCNKTDTSVEIKCLTDPPHDDAEQYALIESRSGGYSITFLPDEDDVGPLGKKTLLKINLSADECVEYLHKLTGWLYHEPTESDMDLAEQKRFIKKVKMPTYADSQREYEEEQKEDEEEE